MTDRLPTSPTARETPSPYPEPEGFTISRYRNSRHWAIHAPDGSLVCVAVYKKGAVEAVRRLNGKEAPRK